MVVQIYQKETLLHTFFSKFLVQLFQTLSWKHLWWSWQFRLLTKFLSLLKNDSTRDSFLTFLEMKLSSKKRLWMIPILVATYNISKSRMVQRRCPSAYCGKCQVRNTSLVLNFSTNDSTSRRTLKNKLFFKSFGKFSDKNYVLGSPCCKILGLYITAYSTVIKFELPA